MDIGRRLFELREAKGMSKGDIAEKSGLLRCYISRVENGHPVPAPNSGKNGPCLDIQLYAFSMMATNSPAQKKPEGPADDWTSQVKGERVFVKLRRTLAQMSDTDRQLLLKMAEKIVTAKRP